MPQSDTSCFLKPQVAVKKTGGKGGGGGGGWDFPQS